MRIDYLVVLLCNGFRLTLGLCQPGGGFGESLIRFGELCLIGGFSLLDDRKIDDRRDGHRRRSNRLGREKLLRRDDGLGNGCSCFCLLHSVDSIDHRADDDCQKGCQAGRDDEFDFECHEYLIRVSVQHRRYIRPNSSTVYSTRSAQKPPFVCNSSHERCSLCLSQTYLATERCGLLRPV